jgi:endonuclease/exonuclease/phosphatase family metal-dependent hydrolase
MPTLAFWNINARVSPETIAVLAREWDVDIIILAENETDRFKILRKLNEDTDRLYFSDRGKSDRLTILTRFQADPASVVTNPPGIAIRHYRLPVGESFLVVAVHLAGKLWSKTEDQVFAAVELGDQIRVAEERVGHSRTIVIGDLNMNPFETGVVGSGGLHGVMDRRIALAGSRVIRRKAHMFFYNPMWSKFGGGGSAPPGTYFYNSGSDVNYFWNMFDQVLVRPALLDSISDESVSIVSRVGGVDLLTKRGRPNSAVASDHLPVICNLSEIQETANGIKESLG